jgi:hypothetical protein
MAVGRISGPLLKNNLLRNGVNLAFETNLLYLDVVNSRIGVNTASPTNELQVNGTTRTTNLIADIDANIASFNVVGNTISSTSGTINLLPAGTNPVVYQATISVGNINIGSDTISTTGVDTNLNISPSGTGSTIVNSDVTVYGNLHATGNITADGNITLGDRNTDTITFAGEVSSDILPSTTNTYNLGSQSLQWAGLYANNLVVNTLSSANIIATDLKTANLEITGNTISAYTNNTDINFTVNGSGGITLGNFRFSGNTITNIAANAISQFVESGTGYVQFSGKLGVVIPSGNSSTDRPPVPALGMVRYNTDSAYVEVYNGTGWVSVAGSGGVSFQTATDIGIEAALTFG